MIKVVKGEIYMLKIINETNKKLIEDKMSDASFYKIVSRVNIIIQDLGEMNYLHYNQVDTMRVELVKIENALTTIERTIEKAKQNEMLKN